MHNSPHLARVHNHDTQMWKQVDKNGMYVDGLRT